MVFGGSGLGGSHVLRGDLTGRQDLDRPRLNLGVLPRPELIFGQLINLKQESNKDIQRFQELVETTFPGVVYVGAFFDGETAHEALEWLYELETGESLTHVEIYNRHTVKTLPERLFEDEI